MLFAMYARLGLAWCLSVLAACSSTTGGTGADAGASDSGRLLAAPLIGPEVFDCRTAGAWPARPATALALGCAFDPGCDARLVVAHRSSGGTAPGVGTLAPENTLSALRAAIALGVDFIETDPRMSKDGVIVNVHDPDIAKTTKGTGMVADLTWDEIRSLALDYPETIEGDFSCDRVITIRELLEAAKGRANVLLDANKLALEEVDALVALVRETDTFAEAIFDTSGLDKVARARALEPAIKVQIRPHAAAEIQGQLEQVGQPPPVIVELEIGSLDQGAPIVATHAAAARVMVDTLGALDLEMAIEGRATDNLLGLFGRGADAVQTDRPDLVLRALGRW